MMKRGWYGESHRHKLARMGIKTTIDNKPVVMNRFSGANDDYVPVEEVRMEIEPMVQFLKVYVDEDKGTARISLADGVSYKQFSNFFPDISKKQLIKLFDTLDEKQKETYFAIKDLEKDGKTPMQKIVTISKKEETIIPKLLPTSKERMIIGYNNKYVNRKVYEDSQGQEYVKFNNKFWKYPQEVEY